mmetsp:Transcript_10153/g.33854  ORF Transcript_10153/g.33854 Transcript_10153/m.33854 type:complete len:154 (-) Transcript_10153:754-1215(-)
MHFSTARNKFVEYVEDFKTTQKPSPGGVGNASGNANEVYGEWEHTWQEVVTKIETHRHMKERVREQTKQPIELVHRALQTVVAKKNKDKQPDGTNDPEVDNEVLSPGHFVESEQALAITIRDSFKPRGVSRRPTRLTERCFSVNNPGFHDSIE